MSEPNTPQPDSWRRALALTLASVAALFALKFGNGFSLDDVRTIVANDVFTPLRDMPRAFTNGSLALMGESGTIDSYRPVSVASFFIDYAIGGTAPWIYHLTNLLLHLACVAVVFKLARRWCPEASPGAIALGAAWFGVHPLLLEAHVWINGRSDMLTTLFAVAAVLLLERRTSDVAARPAWAAGFAWLVAASAKEVVLLMLPVVLLYRARVLSGGRKDWRIKASVVECIPLILASGAYVAARLVVLSGAAAGRATDQLTGLLRLGYLWLDGLTQLIVPRHLAMRVLGAEYAELSTVVFIGAWVVVLAIAVILLWRRPPGHTSFGLLTYLASTAPIGVLAAVQWPGFGRYLYLAAAFFVPSVVELFRWLSANVAQERQRLVSIAVWGYLAALGVRSMIGIGVYESSEAFVRAMYEETPEAKMTWGPMGMYLADDGRYTEAIELLERAHQAQPGHWLTLSELGWAYLESGDRERGYAIALEGLRQSAEPRHPDFHRLAAAASIDANVETALRHWTTCLQIEGAEGRCAADLEIARTVHPRAADVRRLLGE